MLHIEYAIKMAAAMQSQDKAGCTFGIHGEFHFVSIEVLLICADDFIDRDITQMTDMLKAVNDLLAFVKELSFVIQILPGATAANIKMGTGRTDSIR